MGGDKHTKIFQKEDNMQTMCHAFSLRTIFSPMGDRFSRILCCVTKRAEASNKRHREKADAVMHYNESRLLISQGHCFALA